MYVCKYIYIYMSVFWCITVDLQINWTHFPSFSHFFHLCFPSRPPGSVWSVRLPPQRLPSPCCRASGERVGRYVFSCGGWVSWMSWVSLVAEICWCEQSIWNWTKVKNLTNGEQLLWVGFGILLLSLGHSYQSCQRGNPKWLQESEASTCLPRPVQNFNVLHMKYDSQNCAAGNMHKHELRHDASMQQ